MISNDIRLIGNLTKDPERRQNGDDVAAWFTLAVDRLYDGEHTDYFFCKAKGKTAENLCKYKKKGDQIAVSGMMLSYRKEGDDYDRWMVGVEQIKFLGSKSAQGDGEDGQASGGGSSTAGDSPSYRRRRAPER